MSGYRVSGSMTYLHWLNDIISSLRVVLTGDAVVEWLDRPMAKLGWATPIQAIRQGNGADVLKIAEEYSETFYG